MTEQQLNDVWTYRLTESMESAIISDCEGFTVGHIIGVGLFPKKSTEKLAWRIVTDHNLGLLAAHAPRPVDAAGFTLGPVSDGGMDPRDRQPAPAVQGEPMAMVDADDDGMRTEILPDVTVKVVEEGQFLYPAPQPAEQQPTPDVQGEPVSAQFRYRRLERSLPSYSAWSAWQPAKVDKTRPTFYFDEQGWEYEYRLLYTAPQPAPAVQGEPVYLYRRRGLHDFVTCSRERYAELSAKPHLFETKVLYATPQPAKQSTYSVGTDLTDGKLSVVVMKHEDGIAWVIHSEVIQLAEQQPAEQPAEQQPAPDVAGLVEALEQILGWRELRSGQEFPIERIEDIARNALAARRKQGY